MTTLENFYYGNIAPHEYEVLRGSEYDIAAKMVIRHEQELSATLTEQQNAILQKIKDNHTELMNLGERDAFCRGFSLAVRLMVEAMSSEKTWHALFRPVSRETKNRVSTRPNIIKLILTAENSLCNEQENTDNKHDEKTDGQSVKKRYWKRIRIKLFLDF